MKKANPEVRYRPRRGSHAETSVKVNDWFAHIDENIADLIELMWMCGFETQYCCEGYDWPFTNIDEHSWNAQDYRAYICMPRTQANFDLTVNLLSNFERFANGSRVSWDFEFEQSDSEFHKGQNRIVWRFPKNDIPLLVKFITEQYTNVDETKRCVSCGSTRFVRIRLGGPDGFLRAQCVPCGFIHSPDGIFKE